MGKVYGINPKIFSNIWYWEEDTVYGLDKEINTIPKRYYKGHITEKEWKEIWKIFNIKY